VSHRLELDWGEVYGPEWKALDGAAPYSVAFAVGSPIQVFPKGKLVSPVTRP
jgi:hypothetical protein